MLRSLGLVAGTFFVLTGCGEATKAEQKSAEIKDVDFASVFVVDGSCNDYTATAGTTFQCPANRVLTAVHDRYEPIGRFETYTCCSLRGGGMNLVAASAPSAHYFNWGAQTNCPGNRIATGVTYDSNGVPVAIQCRLFRRGGSYAYKVGAQNNHVFANGSSAYCGGEDVVMGMGDVFNTDGVLDNVACQRLAY